MPAAAQATCTSALYLQGHAAESRVGFDLHFDLIGQCFGLGDGRGPEVDRWMKAKPLTPLWVQGWIFGDVCGG